MGLFSSAPLDDDLAAALCTGDRRARKLVGKGAAGIRAEVPPGDR